MVRSTSDNGATILVVDDEQRITDLLERVLDRAGYRTVCANDGLEGMHAFFESKPDLAILDIIMPGMDGKELCNRIREVSQIPVIFLTGRVDVADRVEGLEWGADYYLTKPVSMVELVAVVKTVLRRSAWSREAGEALHPAEALSIDYDQRVALVRGEQVSLTPLEFRLLDHLVRHAGRVFDYTELLSEVWNGRLDSPDVVRRYVLQLRQKIEDDPDDPRFIVTKRGFGYSYQPPV